MTRAPTLFRTRYRFASGVFVGILNGGIKRRVYKQREQREYREDGPLTKGGRKVVIGKFGQPDNYRVEGRDKTSDREARTREGINE